MDNIHSEIMHLHHVTIQNRIQCINSTVKKRQKHAYQSKVDAQSKKRIKK